MNDMSKPTTGVQLPATSPEEPEWRVSTKIRTTRFGAIGIAFSALNAFRIDCDYHDAVIDRAIDDAVAATIGLASALSAKRLGIGALPYEGRGRDFVFDVEDVVCELEGLLSGDSEALGLSFYSANGRAQKHGEWQVA